MQSQTRFTYLYRDASNYKHWAEFITSGEIKLPEIRPFLFDSEWFIPDRIGLKNLVPNPRNEDDHDLHELHAVEPCEGGRAFCGRDAFIQRLRTVSAKGWFSEKVSTTAIC